MILKVVQYFGTNNCIIGICSICTLLGFFMTIYVTVKSKKIHESLHEYKKIIQYNKETKKIVTACRNYQKSLMEDDVKLRKVRVDILNDLLVAKKKFDDILTRHERKELSNAIKVVKVSQNIEYICANLSSVIAIFSLERES